MRRQSHPMGLSDIAQGVEVTTEQRERGVATVDRTGTPLAARLEPLEPSLPTDASVAARVIERYAAGGSVGQAAAQAGVPAVTAAKTLHLAGESVSPLGPTGREVVRDWIAGRLSRTDALALTRAAPAELALAAYVETHDPIDAVRDAVEGAIDAGALADRTAATLAEATETPDALR
jgi:hypothetical protein